MNWGGRWKITQRNFSKKLQVRLIKLIPSGKISKVFIHLNLFNIDFSQSNHWDFEVITIAYFHQSYIGAISMLENGLEENNRIIAENSAKIYEAQNHATALETQVL